MTIKLGNDKAPRLSRAEAKAETRRRLLEAADDVFKREGYHRASLDRVAAEAGFTIGAVYSTFDSKAGVMLALLAARGERTREELAEVLSNATTVEDFVAESARRVASRVVAERDWSAVVIEFLPIVGRDPELRARYAELHETSRSALTDAVRTWMRRTGEGSAIPPRQVSTLIVALNRGLVLEELVVPEEVPEKLLVEAQLALLRGTRGGAQGAEG